MRLQILTLGKTLFDGEASEITLPAQDGEITVLKNHVPLITALKSGMIRTHEQEIPVAGGFAEITGSKVVVLAN